MLFNSYEFILLFVPITFLGFFLLGRYQKHRLATFWLVAASVFFYGWWNYCYTALLLASITFNYLIGKTLERTSGKKGILAFGIAANLALLGYFKYTDFFLSILNTIQGTDSFQLLHIVLPLGISFFTFTQIAYLVDVYRGETKNESFLIYCEFVTIFPHLIAGPIISYKEMLPQFTAPKTFILDMKNVAIGIAIFTIGLAKKVLIADHLSLWVNEIFSHTSDLTFLEAWIGAIAYTLQLYFDFSGYSEMAIGLGLMFNLKLPINFNSPYKATSIIDFWRRWHMTLGGWVKNYLYIPMGGNRCGEWRKMRNLFTAMMLIGLWHGAGWTFVIWGSLHGILLVINHQWRRLKIQLPKLLSWGMTFLCVVICWVFFRAATLTDALNILTAMTDIYHIGLPDSGSLGKHLSFLQAYGVDFEKWTMSESCSRILINLTILLTMVITIPNPLKLLQNEKILFRYKIVPVILGVLFGIILLAMNVSTSEFLYFQF